MCFKVTDNFGRDVPIGHYGGARHDGVQDRGELFMGHSGMASPLHDYETIVWWIWDFARALVLGWRGVVGIWVVVGWKGVVCIQVVVWNIWGVSQWGGRFVLDLFRLTCHQSVRGRKGMRCWQDNEAWSRRDVNGILDPRFKNEVFQEVIQGTQRQECGAR